MNNRYRSLLKIIFIDQVNQRCHIDRPEFQLTLIYIFKHIISCMMIIEIALCIRNQACNRVLNVGSRDRYLRLHHLHQFHISHKAGIKESISKFFKLLSRSRKPKSSWSKSSCIAFQCKNVLFIFCFCFFRIFISTPCSIFFIGK